MTFLDAPADRTDGGLRWGVEPIWRVLSAHGLQIAPATCYAATSRPPSPRRVREEQLKARITELHAANYGVYGVRKMHAALLRDAVAIGRDQRPADARAGPGRRAPRHGPADHRRR